MVCHKRHTFKFLFMRKILYLLVVVLCVACGKQKEQENIRRINVSVDNVDNDKFAYSHCSFVKLETSDECLLENVVKTEFVSNDIYLLSSYGGKVYKYSKEGDFLWSLSKGNGPGELVFPTDFCFSETDNCLYVLDSYRTIKKYKPDGTFVESAQLNTPAFLFEKSKDGYLMFNSNLTSNSKHYLDIYRNDTLFSSLLPIADRVKKVSFMPSNVFVESDKPDEYYIQHMLSDTIYTYDLLKHDMVPSFYIDTDEKSVNSQSIEFKDSRSFHQICKENNLISGVAGLSLLNEKMYLMMFYEDKQWYIVHDLKSATTFTTNRLCEGIPNSLRCVGRNEEFTIYAYRPEDFYEKEGELGSDARALLQEVKEGDNPILVLLN